METINLTYSDKSYPIRTDIEKIIEKMVCDIGIIKITDLEPFMNIVEPLNKNNINLLKNLLKNVKKKKETDKTQIQQIEANLVEINAKVGELENNIKSDATKKKEAKKKEEADRIAKEEADRISKEEAKKKEEADRLAKEEEEELNNAPYKILGLNKNATKEDIKGAFRKMSLTYHPDRIPVANTRHPQYIVENTNKINDFFGGIKSASDILNEIIKNQNDEESIRNQHKSDYKNIMEQIKNQDDITKLTAIKGGKKITRKSSSRVSRKTRRHKRTSR